MLRKLFASLLLAVQLGACAVTVIFAVLLRTQGYGYGRDWLARRHAARQVTRTEAAHTTRAAAEPQQRYAFGSTCFTLAGRQLEAQRTRQLSQHRYDSIRAVFPAAVLVRPASPPCYRPADEDARCCPCGPG